MLFCISLSNGARIRKCHTLKLHSPTHPQQPLQLRGRRCMMARTEVEEVQFSPFHMSGIPMMPNLSEVLEEPENLTQKETRSMAVLPLTRVEKAWVGRSSITLATTSKLWRRYRCHSVCCCGKKIKGIFYLRPSQGNVTS